MTTATLTKVVLTGSQIKEIQTVAKSMGITKYVEQFNNAMVTVAGDTLTVFLTNLELTVTLKYNMDTYQDNTTFFLPYDVIKQIKLGKKEEIALEIENNTLTIIQNGIKQFVKLADWANEYPSNHNYGNIQHTLTLNNEYFQALKDAIAFTSKSESRPILTTVQHKKGSIIATDSYRLFQSDNKFDELDQSFVVSSSTAKLVSELITEGSLIVYENHTQYSNNSVTVTECTQEGSYPETSRIIPYDFKSGECELQQELLVPVLEQIKKAKFDPNFTVEFKFEKSKLNVSAGKNSIQAGIEIENSSIDNFKIGFNSSFLLDALKQIGKGKVKFQFVGSTSPFIVRNKDKEFHLIVPVRNY